MNIPAYNGGLFAPDPALDALQVPDEDCAHFKELGDYDYRAARELADADANTEVRSVVDADKRYKVLDGLTGRRQHSLSLLLPKR